MEPDTANNLSPEVIAAIISASGAIVSAIIAWISARFTAKREIRKMQLSWEREDYSLREKNFADMSAAVSRYIQSGWPKHQRQALEAISFVQSTSPGLTSELSNLYEDVLGGQPENCKISLSEVVLLHQQVTTQQQVHRNTKRNQNTE